MSTPLEKVAEQSKIASRTMAKLSNKIKKAALKKAACVLIEKQEKILESNRIDLKNGEKENLSPALLDRLTLNPNRILQMANALKEVASFPDPNGEIVREWKNRDQMRIQKVRVPLGVVAIIYESRPNVTIESASLCLKAGNSVILRGGREALHSNSTLCRLFSQAIVSEGVPKNSVMFISELDRNNIYQLCRMDQWIDCVIARGSELMVREIKKRATVPVLGHGKGLCHVYIDQHANLKMAEEIAFNSKVQRPGVCNAMETLLVHTAVAKKFLPVIRDRYKKAHVILKGDETCRKILPQIRKATEKDWSTEYLDLMLSIKVVDSLDSAIEHINRYGSGHTDTIVTKDLSAAKKFLSSVDSSSVFCNASTRMHDGGIFGLGAEIGISTQKLHARGTMGVRELTTTKYIGMGSGQIRK